MDKVSSMGRLVIYDTRLNLEVASDGSLHKDMIEFKDVYPKSRTMRVG